MPVRKTTRTKKTKAEETVEDASIAESQEEAVPSSPSADLRQPLSCSKRPPNLCPWARRWQTCGLAFHLDSEPKSERGHGGLFAPWLEGVLP